MRKRREEREGNKIVISNRILSASQTCCAKEYTLVIAHRLSGCDRHRQRCLMVKQDRLSTEGRESKSNHSSLIISDDFTHSYKR